MYTALYNLRLNRVLLFSGLLFYWVLSLICFQLSEGPVDASDGIFHYQIARYSWEMPESFLNHWGKPMFTILSSPFAQFGFVGMIVFNLVLFSISSWCLYLFGVKFKLPLAGLAPIILMSSMVFFQMVNAGMTEILMATLTILALYLFAKNKPIAAAIITSLTIVTRPESIIIIPLFALIFALASNWKAIPFLAFGFIIFSLCGFLYFDKPILWVIGEDPYPAISPYGNGEIDHFLKEYKLIFGRFLFISGLIGLIIFLATDVQYVRHSRLSQSLLFCFAATFLILALHSVLWWKGLKGSMGLIRVMATVTPLVCLTSLYTLKKLTEWKWSKVTIPIFLVFLLISCNNAFHMSGIPTKMDSQTRVLAEAAKWYNAQNHKGRVSYLDPYFAFKAKINPDNNQKVLLLWGLDKQDPSKSLNPGDIIIWDSRFGPRECQIPEESITNNPNLTIEKYIESNEYPDELGKYYRIYIARVNENNVKGS